MVKINDWNNSGWAIALATFLWYRRSPDWKAEAKLNQSLDQLEADSTETSPEPQLSQTS